ncbi:syringate O-demethylase [Kordiimonas marina]|uniref:syringate O-demethylase n=1 Tax=Kordiimonas marina TaxID=2872312 RepID=UPI001FF51D80|nr:hypothetical protein [Kordiimonas marina]MCJ9427778.1 hypothetical protein [Kordiimonas marina]
MYKNLEEKLQAAGNIPDLLRNIPAGPNAYPGVPAEYSNWRDEQASWYNACILFDQSYHMVDLAVEGPDAFKLLNDLAFNTFKNFVPGKAKQFAPCTPSGHIIGDVILFYLAENKFNLVGRAPSINWVEYHAATGGYNVQCERDERTAVRTDKGTRKSYRFQVQGPNAMAAMEKILGHTPPDLKFFTMTDFTIAGRQVKALRHGMAGQPGFELFGPWEDYQRIRDALLEGGREFGMLPCGGRTYSSNTLESGWIPSPLPGIYTGDDLKAYREWLPADGYEGNSTIGGSFYSDNIEDYYLTPWDLGYGNFVKFDHDFIGRDALEKIANQPHRQKVTLALNTNDVMEVIYSQFQKGDQRGKFIEFPSAVYAMHPYDRVTVGGKTAGLSTWIGYSSNERTMMTLAMMDAEHANMGDEVVLVWGEENGGSGKLTVEKHVQMEIRATVSPVPYVEVARKQYAGDVGGWRSKR